jgi:histidine ammonia-lyase
VISDPDYFVTYIGLMGIRYFMDVAHKIVLGLPTVLTVDQIARLANDPASIVLADEFSARLDRVRELAASLSVSRPIYGRGTGVGANKGIAVTNPDTHALGLLRSHATSAGPLRSRPRVRAMLAVRCAQLAVGGSGIAPEIVQALVAMLNADALPPVRELGSIGTADLCALATTALTLMGEIEPLVPTPVRFDENDALAFISSNAATLGDAALAVAALSRLASTSLAVAALTFTAIDGNAEAFSIPVQGVTPFPGAARVCANLRGLLAEAPAGARIQDPFGLRVLPQVQGVLFDALATAAHTVEALVSSASENPVFDPTTGTVAHHGGFHFAYLATALDTMRSALAQSAQLHQARLANLIDPTLTGLAAFLGNGTAAASGVMILEYVSASALAPLRVGATPTAIQSLSISRGMEDDASFASLGAALSLDAIAPYRTVLACELVAAVRAIRMRGLAPTGPIAALLDACSNLPTSTADRNLSEDIAAADALLDALGDQVRQVS